MLGLPLLVLIPCTGILHPWPGLQRYWGSAWQVALALSDGDRGGMRACSWVLYGATLVGALS